MGYWAHKKYQEQYLTRGLAHKKRRGTDKFKYRKNLGEHQLLLSHEETMEQTEEKIRKYGDDKTFITVPEEPLDLLETPWVEFKKTYFDRIDKQYILGVIEQRLKDETMPDFRLTVVQVNTLNNLRRSVHRTIQKEFHEKILYASKNGKGATRASARDLLTAVMQDRFPGEHPVIALMEIGFDRSEDTSVRIQALAQAANYVAPKLKQVDVEANVNTNSGVMKVPARAIEGESWTEQVQATHEQNQKYAEQLADADIVAE